MAPGNAQTVTGQSRVVVFAGVTAACISYLNLGRPRLGMFGCSRSADCGRTNGASCSRQTKTPRIACSCLPYGNHVDLLGGGMGVGGASHVFDAASGSQGEA